MKQKGKMSGKKLKQMFVTYTFVLPDFIGLLVFIIIPIIYSFYMSLYDWNFANIKQFIGIQNYVTMFSDSEWWQSLGRTFKLTLLYVPALFILSILIPDIFLKPRKISSSNCSSRETLCVKL